MCKTPCYTTFGLRGVGGGGGGGGRRDRGNLDTAKFWKPDLEIKKKSFE